MAKKIGYGVLMVLFCLMTGCGRTEEPAADAGEVFEGMEYYQKEDLPEGGQIPSGESTGAVWSHSAHVTDNGVFFFSGDEGLLEYEDWQSNTVYPLCAKPNCLHHSETCAAWFPTDKMPPEALYYDGEYLYFERAGEAGETIFYRQNLDGSDRKQLFSQEGYLAPGVVYDGNEVYYLTSVAGEEDDQEASMALEYSLNCGNLSDGKSRQLPYKWTVERGDVSLLGKYGRQVVLRCSVQTGETESDGWPVTDETIFVLNLDSGEKNGLGEGLTLQADMFESDAVSDGIFAEQYLDTDPDSEKMRNGFSCYPSSIVIESLEGACAYRLPGQVWNIWDLTVLDRKVFYYVADEPEGELVPAAFDLKTGSQIMISPELGDFHIFGETEQWFYGMIYGENAPEVKVRILKSDFYAGNPAYIGMSGEW